MREDSELKRQTCRKHYLFTQERDIDQGVPSGRRLEVHPAPVDPGLSGSDVLHHEGRGAAEVKVGAIPEHELVTPPGPHVPRVFPRVVAEERSMNVYDLKFKMYILIFAICVSKENSSYDHMSTVQT